MPTPEKILKEMDAILNELLATAEKLQNISTQVISKQELDSLQRAQTEMVKKLIELDNSFKHAYANKETQLTEKNKELRNSIERKLTRFEELNAHFIENLSNTHSLLEKKDIK